MTKEVFYTYLGTNGIITSPVHLEDIYYTRKYRLTAKKGCLLIGPNEEKLKSVMVPEDEASLWSEISE